MPRLIAAAAAACWLAGCANPGAPPGGPPDQTPPKLVARVPDTVAVLPGFRGAARFCFDEIVNEGSEPDFGLGNGSLEKQVLMSPDTAVPDVSWQHRCIGVKPKRGWKPNTVYRIELLPGVGDLQDRPNLTTSPYVITFATGGPLPTRYLRGRAVDWNERQGVKNALIEATDVVDSVTYRAVSDSTGRFQFGPLPDGAYLVLAAVDKNADHFLQHDEAWDTVRVAAGRDSVGEIWAYLRDTLPPKVQSIARRDSTDINVTLTLPVDPRLRLPADSIRVLALPDSQTITPSFAMAEAAYDSLYKPVKAADSTKTGADTSKAAPAQAPPGPPQPGAAPLPAARAPTTKQDLPARIMPVLGPQIVVRTFGRVRDGTNYYVEVHGVRLANGVTGTVSKVLAVPKPPPVDTAKVRADSIKRAAAADSARRAHGDTTGGAARGDSTRPPAGRDSIPRQPAKPDTGGGRGGGGGGMRHESIDRWWR